MPGGTIQCISFNAAQDCFIVGLDNGVRVFNVEPLVEMRYLDQKTVGSVRLCRMLGRSNLFALVGGGAYAKFADNTVLIWDDTRRAFIQELTFSARVLNVLMSHTRLVVVLTNIIHVFTFPSNVHKLCTLDTTRNPTGLADLCLDGTAAAEFLVFPARKTGSVQLTNLRLMSQNQSVAPVLIDAHNSALVALTLNNQATLMATGSQLGTVIRVFDVRTRVLLSEFRRGSDPANLQCLRMSVDSQYLVVASDKGTVHVFAVRDRQANRKSILQQVGVVTEETQRSLAKFNPTSEETRCHCAFVNNQTVVVLTDSGAYHKYGISPDGATNRLGFDLFLELGDDIQFWNVKNN